MTNPYSMLPRGGSAFWQPAVGSRNALEIEGLWSPRNGISSDDRIVTAGSCFAQHISRALSRSGFKWVDAEPAPEGLDADVAKRFGYGVFSFRTGNIYSVALLRQWVAWALGDSAPADEVWERDGRFFDPVRPVIEPNGFASADEVRQSRLQTLTAIRHAIESGTVFVFTLGLTEGWENSETGLCYAMCPGTLAGTFDASRHVFHNYRYGRIVTDLTWVIERARQINPDLRFLLTVSPVPLTATASGDHVLAATTYSKSVLRAVAGDLRADFACVDYFPSYEIITAPVFRGAFYQPNAREVSHKGVEFVMAHFFAGLAAIGGSVSAQPFKQSRQFAAGESLASVSGEDVQCEEAMLEAFATS